ncbi:uncharacterized protein LOC114156856 isoform X1 [Xiphophorus couchianus]|uniref:uncharacterized protein LOC114156856 isoform X1 n=1 Tax=Xiphophorus couchianus TaxID=32473 RepID=UPI0010166D39|nr:uncharacterized protein LOC114156856 isoform X1 [Xiphophorus couchianus]
MALLLTSLLLLCAGSSWSVSSDALVVTQSPDVSVQEGETGSITCCWKGAERVGIKWLKNQTLIENKTVINQSTGSKNEQKNMCSVLIIENMTTGDSGRYICKVSMEIPVLKEVEGKGTTITVIARENITKSTLEVPLDRSKPNNIIFILRGLPIPLLIAALICVECLVHKAQKNQPPAAPGNKSTSAQSREEERGDDGGTEREEEENEETR